MATNKAQNLRICALKLADALLDASKNNPDRIQQKHLRELFHLLADAFPEVPPNTLAMVRIKVTTHKFIDVVTWIENRIRATDLIDRTASRL